MEGVKAFIKLVLHTLAGMKFINIGPERATFYSPEEEEWRRGQEMLVAACEKAGVPKRLISFFAPEGGN